MGKYLVYIHSEIEALNIYITMYVPMYAALVTPPSNDYVDEATPALNPGRG